MSRVKRNLLHILYQELKISYSIFKVRWDKRRQAIDEWHGPLWLHECVPFYRHGWVKKDLMVKPSQHGSQPCSVVGWANLTASKDDHQKHVTHQTIFFKSHYWQLRMLYQGQKQPSLNTKKMWQHSLHRNKTGNIYEGTSNQWIWTPYSYQIQSIPDTPIPVPLSHQIKSLYHIKM